MSGCTENLPGQINRKKSASIHIYIEEMQKLPVFLGISMSLGWKTGEVDQKIHEKYQRVEVGAYLRVCEILEKSIYGQQNLEPYEMRAVSAFMKKLEVIGDNTLNRRENRTSIWLCCTDNRKNPSKNRAKRKNKKKQQKRIDKIKGKGHKISIKKH